MLRVITRQKIDKKNPHKHPVEIVTEPMSFADAVPALMALRAKERRGQEWHGYAHVMQTVSA